MVTGIFLFDSTKSKRDLSVGAHIRIGALEQIIDGPGMLHQRRHIERT